MYSERRGFPYGWFITEVKREIRIRCISKYTQLRYDCISYAGTCLIRHEVYSYCEKVDQKFDGDENEVERKRNFIQTRTNCRERSTRCPPDSDRVLLRSGIFLPSWNVFRERRLEDHEGNTIFIERCSRFIAL